MRIKATKTLAACLAAILIFAACGETAPSNKIEAGAVRAVTNVSLLTYTAPTYEPAQFVYTGDIPEKPASDWARVTDDEIELIALVTVAEAEGECEEGRRLVIDTILNRVDSEQFPDTIFDVIYQPKQFTVMWNGRAEQCEVSEDIRGLVREELASRLNSDVIFFTSGGYSEYGAAMFKVGNHYFSSYD